MKKNHNQPGAFGGYYNHQVIKELKAELAKNRIMLAALVEHARISQDDLMRVSAEYVQRSTAQMEKDKIS